MPSPLPSETLDTERASERRVYDARPDPHLLDFLLLLARVKWVVISLVALGGIVSVVLMMHLPFVFESRAMVLPPDRNSSAGLLDRFQASGALKLLKEVENPSVDLLQNILEARTIAEHIASDSEIGRYYDHYLAHTGEYSSKVDWVLGTIVVVPSSTAVRVNTTVSTGWNPDDKEKEACRLVSARIANAATSELITFFNSGLQNAARRSRVFAERDLAERARVLDSLERAKEQFEAANKVAALPSQLTALIQVQAELQARLASLEIKERIRSYSATPADPEMQNLRQSINATRLQLDNYDATTGVGVALGKAPLVQRELASVTKRILGLEPVVAFLRQEVEQERINEHRTSDVIQVLDPALPPTRKSSPKRAILLLLGLTIGGALSAIYVMITAFVHEARTHGARTYLRASELA